MSGRPRSRASFALTGVLLVATGCSDAAPSPSARSSDAAASAIPTASVAASEDSASARPARPYGVEELLELLRTSRRPGGVPEEVATVAVAAQLAEAVWTLDGRPSAAMSASAACGAASCSLELVAVRDDSMGEDVWRFTVDPAAGEVSLVGAELGAVPDDVRERLDALARGSAFGPQLEGLFLADARWHWAPPIAYELRYRTGDDEEACEIDLALETADGAWRVMDSRGC